MVDINDIKVILLGHAIDLPFNVRHVVDTKNLAIDIAAHKPDIILSVGPSPSIMKSKEYSLRHKWLHFDAPNVPVIINAVREAYFKLVYQQPELDDNFPLMTIYTPTYNTGALLQETYHSVCDQTYTNWEWVVVDDGSTDGTWERLLELAKLDHRVRPFRMPNNGKIGNSKDVATRLAYGKYLCELDHDDILVETCLEEVKKAFDENPSAGMVYTDFAEVYADGRPNRYHGAPWESGHNIVNGKRILWNSFHDEKYVEVIYRGKKYLQVLGPDIYDGFSDRTWDRFSYFLTVGPNHMRAFRADVLRKLGGYNRHFPVADDFDLFHRMFIHSKIVRVPKMLYIYRFHDQYGNTTFTRNKSIQDHLQIARNNYFPIFNQANNARIKANGFSYFSIIILSWNTKDLTKQCVESAIASLNGKFSEVVVIDNGSTDGSPEMLREFGDKIRLFELEDNIGFAAGCNLGAQLSRDGCVPYSHWLIFVNSDCIINRNAVQSVINSLFYGNNITVAGAYSNYTAFGQCPSQEAANNLPEIDVPMVPGLFLGVNKGIFKDIGGFDTKLTTWEDYDLCKRMQRRGHRTVLSAGAWVWHKGHASFDNAGVDADKVQDDNKLIFDSLNQKIAAVCIAKNEGNIIQQWINQWKGFVDQVVVVDTGSSDNTKEAAAACGAKVVDYHVDDINDFSFADARNKAISESDADWVVMLDVDETLDEATRTNMRSFLSAPYDIFLAKILAKNYDGSERAVIGRPFLFRKTQNIQWISRVHEKLIGSTRQAWLTNSTICHDLTNHDQSRRAAKEPWYEILRSKEPFYTDKAYRASIEEQYPILDWHHPDDERIARYQTGDLISVVMPTYNRKEMLLNAIESVEGQTYQNWELIIVGDNCSALNEVKETKVWDKRIKFFNLKTNHGAGGAVPRNFGIDIARGKYIAYLDDDCTYKPFHLQTLYANIISGDFKYSLGSFTMVEPDGSKSVDIICDAPRLYRIDTSSILHERSLIDLYGKWETRRVGYAHDAEFVLRWKCEPYVLSKEITVIYINTAGQNLEFIKNA